MRVRAWAMLAVLAAATLLIKASGTKTAVAVRWALAVLAVLLLVVAAVLTLGLRRRSFRRR